MRYFNKLLFSGLGAGVVVTIALIFLAGYILVTAMSSSEGGGATRKTPESPSHQQQSVYEQAGSWSIRTLGGTEIAFSKFKGNVVFLNFWATWCPPCVAEMPSIQNLYNSLKDDDVAFVLVCYENEKTVQRFMEKNRFTFPVYLIGEDVPDVFRTRAIPVTYILDRKGMIVFRHAGAIKWDDESCLKFFRGLMQ